jgi:hypothetical protein
MGIFEKIFRKQKSKNPEDDFIVTVTDTFVKVEHLRGNTQQVS